MVAQIKSVEYATHALDLFKLGEVLLVSAPGLWKLIFNSFKTPQETEDHLILLHDFLGENCGYRGQIMQAIVQAEDLPAFISRRWFQ